MSHTPHVTRSETYFAELRREFPGLRLVPKKDVWHQRWAGALLRIATLGRMSSYMSHYTTVLLRTIYVPTGWETKSDDEKYITLRHEAVHLRQFRRYTLPGMALLYVLLPLPLGLAWFRARFEREAYEESIRACAEVWGADAPAQARYRANVIRQFVGPAYGWMWPFRRALERWYDGVLASLPSPGVC